MDFVFALAVPVSIAGESVASRVSVSLMAALCDGNQKAGLVCGLIARGVEDYGKMLRQFMGMGNRKVCDYLLFCCGCFC
jgi:hypothetical protein